MISCSDSSRHPVASLKTKGGCGGKYELSTQLLGRQPFLIALSTNFFRAFPMQQLSVNNQRQNPLPTNYDQSQLQIPLKMLNLMQR